MGLERWRGSERQVLRRGRHQHVVKRPPARVVAVQPLKGCDGIPARAAPYQRALSERQFASAAVTGRFAWRSDPPYFTAAGAQEDARPRRLEGSRAASPPTARTLLCHGREQLQGLVHHRLREARQPSLRPRGHVAHLAGMADGPTDAVARASASPVATSTPLRPSSMTSSAPPKRAASTGTPCAIASSTENGVPSKWLGKAKRSATRSSSDTFATWPSSRTRSRSAAEDAAGIAHACRRMCRASSRKRSDSVKYCR